VHVFRWPLLVMLAVGLVGCSDSAPVLNAVGSYSDVAIITDLDLFNGFAYTLERELEVDSQTGLRAEPLFNADVFDMRSMSKARLYKNIIIVGFVNGRDQASREIQRRLKGGTLSVLPSRHLLFADRDDVYANNQNVIFLAGYDRSFMQSALADEAAALRGQMEEENRSRVFEYLTSLGRNAEGEKTLRENVGIRMTLPEGYRVNGIKENASGDLGMVEVVHENPTRGVVVFWKEVEEPGAWDMDDPDPQVLLALRRQWGLFLDEVIQDGFGHTWSATVFRGDTLPQLAGMYEVRSASLGGPFRTIFFTDVPTKRLYGINIYTFNPNGDKHPYLREALAVAETFVPRP